MKKYLLVILLLCIIIPNWVEASGGSIKADNIISCNGTYYGYHGDDKHWHEAVKKDSGRWYPKGSAIYESNPCGNKTTTKKKTTTTKRSTTTTKKSTTKKSTTVETTKKKTTTTKKTKTTVKKTTSKVTTTKKETTEVVSQEVEITTVPITTLNVENSSENVEESSDLGGFLTLWSMGALGTAGYCLYKRNKK